MKTMIMITTLWIVLIDPAGAQSIRLPVASPSAGGVKSSGPTLEMRSSGGIPAAVLTGGGGDLHLQSGFIPAVEMFTGTTASVSTEVSDVWNLISVPMLTDDNRKSVLYPSAVSPAFAYRRGYQAEDTLSTGVGYWLKFPADTTLEFQGTSLVRETLSVVDRWNLIGGLTYPVPVSEITLLAPATLASLFYGYSGDLGYFDEDTLKPGKGYWIKVHNAGQMIVEPGSPIEPGMSTVAAVRRLPREGTPAESESEFSTIRITDARGQSRTLYFSSSATGPDPEASDLPPLPPAGTMDVRYASNRLVESARAEAPKEVPLVIFSADYPLSLRWVHTAESGAAIVIEGKEIAMKGEGGTSIIKAGSGFSLRLSSAVPDGIPREFSLEQNYPNPFNPATVIRYALPARSHVTIIVFNLLGQEMKTLVDEVQDPGYKTVQLNAAPMPSGVYFYRLSAGSFTGVKKMVLVK